MDRPRHAAENLSPQSLVHTARTLNTEHSAKPDQDGSSSTARELSPDLVDRLHARMTEIYGHRWTSAYDRSGLSTWAAGLAGMTEANIRTGITRCVRDGLEWPPTLPQFIALCKPRAEDIGLPDDDQAFKLACRMASDKRHAGAVSLPDTRQTRIIWHAVNQIGVHELTEMIEPVARKAFDRVWPRVLEAALRGDPPPEIPKALPTPKDVRVPMTAEKFAEIDRRLAAIGVRVAP